MGGGPTAPVRRAETHIDGESPASMLFANVVQLL